MSDPSREAFEAFANRNFHGIAALSECHCGEDGYYNRAQVAEMAWLAAVSWATQRERERCDAMLEQVQEFLEQRYGNTLGQDWHDEDAAAIGDAIEALRAETEGK